MSDSSPLSLDDLFKDLLATQKTASDGLPPVHLWHPDKSGDMDLVIDREGRWIHEGGEIKRTRLVKLFSTILKREGDSYFLVTPVEKWKINVDFAPFYIISASRAHRDSHQAITLTTSTGEVVVVGEENPLWVEYRSGSEEPIPLVTVRDNLPGLLSRSVFYQLVEWAHNDAQNDRHSDNSAIKIESMGEQFLLGKSV